MSKFYIIFIGDKNNEYYLPEILLSLNEDVKALKYEGTYYDIGSHLGFVKANVMYYLKNAKDKEEFLDFIKELSE